MTLRTGEFPGGRPARAGGHFRGGGLGGVQCNMSIQRADGTQAEMDANCFYELHTNDEVLIESSGGRGYGPPSERDRAALEADIRNVALTQEPPAATTTSPLPNSTVFPTARRRSAATPGMQATSTRCCVQSMSMYSTYMPNKTISLPHDVVEIIESLDVPFSRWVTDQLRRHGAQSTMSFAQQLAADAALAKVAPPSQAEASATGERMERSAPW